MIATLKESAARSVARRSKKKDVSPAPPAPPAPRGIVKTSPGGKRYRILTIPLMELPRYLESEGLEPKAYFFYPPENDYVLGVRRKGETEAREL